MEKPTHSRYNRGMADTPVLDAPPPFLKLITHELRWKLLAALARGDYRVRELVRLLDEPQNLLSYHLKQLQTGRLVSARRSDADAREVYYQLDSTRLADGWAVTRAALIPLPSSARSERPAVATTPVRVLFLCTANSARSQMAEGLLRRLGGSRVAAYSAGSTPAPVHPLAIRVMAQWGIDLRAQRSKPLDKFRGQRFDYVITVCDRMHEVCPEFPGDPAPIHWSLPDPVAVSASAQDPAFVQVAQELYRRLSHFLAQLNLLPEVPHDHPRLDSVCRQLRPFPDGRGAAAPSSVPPAGRV